MKLEEMKPKVVAKYASLFLLDPHTCSEYLKKCSAEDGIIFLEEHRRLVEEREIKRMEYLIKESQKNWLQRLLRI